MSFSDQFSQEVQIHISHGREAAIRLVAEIEREILVAARHGDAMIAFDTPKLSSLAADGFENELRSKLGPLFEIKMEHRQSSDHYHTAIYKTYVIWGLERPNVGDE